MANQPDILVADRQEKKTVVVDLDIPSNSNVRNKEHEELEKVQGPNEKQERM